MPDMLVLLAGLAGVVSRGGGGNTSGVGNTRAGGGNPGTTPGTNTIPVPVPSGSLSANRTATLTVE